MFSPKKILIICLSGMGNFLLFTPALRHYRRCYPNAQIDILVRWHFLVDLLEHNSNISRVHVFDEKKFLSPLSRLKYILELRSENYDTTICAFPSNRWQYNLLPILLGVRNRCSHHYPNSRGLTFSWLQNTRVEAIFGLHDLEQNENLAKFITGQEVQNPKLVYTEIPSQDLEFGLRIREMAAGRKIVAIHPSFDSSQPYKSSPEQRYQFMVGLVEILREKFSPFILFIGGPSEKTQIQKLSALTKDSPPFFVGQSITQSAGLLKHSDLLINIDSGLGHLATVVKTPSITIFGPADPRRTKPSGEGQMYLRADCKGAKFYLYPHLSSRQKEDCDAGLWFAHVTIDNVIEKINGYLT